MTKTITLSLIAAAGLSASAAAQGVLTSRDTLSIPFDIGDGNSNTNFSISRFEEGDGNVIELGIKAKERWFGDSNVGGSGTLYIVQDGFSPVSGDAGAALSDDAWWNFDTSVNLGARMTESVMVVLSVDNQPGNAAWSQGFTTGNPLAPLPAGESIVQASQNLGFSPLDLLTNWNAFDQGDYTFTLAVRDLTQGETMPVLASTSMTVRVVPTPASAAVLGAAGLVATRRRR